MLCDKQVPAVVIDAHKEPVPPSSHRVRPFTVRLPEFVWSFCSEKLPVLVGFLIAIETILFEHTVNTRS
jgi:hypothetical protein